MAPLERRAARRQSTRRRGDDGGNAQHGEAFYRDCGDHVTGPVELTGEGFTSFYCTYLVVGLC